MLASDITADDIGAEITIPVGGYSMSGKLSVVSWPLGWVRLTFGYGGRETSIAMDGGNNIIVSRDHLRFRALTEEDTERRGRFLLELNHLGVMRLLGDVLGGTS